MTRRAADGTQPPAVFSFGDARFNLGAQMSSLHPISRSRHTSKRWHHSTRYDFVSGSAVVPLALAEVPKAALALPVAFFELDGLWTLAAVLGLLPAQNLFVEANGQWTGTYLPAVLRAYPFALRANEAGETILCVDEASGLVNNGPNGEAFFDDAGEPSAAIKQVFAFLTETARGEAALAASCGTLHSIGVIEPWPVSVKRADGTQQVAGLHRIHEAALNKLDDAAFGELRRAGLVGLAYAQLLSMGNLTDLGRRAQASAEAEAAERAKAEVKPMITLPEDSSIDWDWSKIGR